MWKADATEQYHVWFGEQDSDSRSVLNAKVMLLETFGPQLGRPHADTP